MLNNASGGNERLADLQRREAALKAAIAAEQVKQRRRKEKDNARLVRIVGAALVGQAASSPDLHLMLKQILGGAVTDPAARRFLEETGWL